MKESAFEPLPATLPTPEQIDGLLSVRRSTRAYKKKPVNRDLIMACLNIVRRAPSAKNSQKLHWIVLDGREKVRELAKEVIFGIEAVSMQPALLDQWVAGHDRMLRGAPMVVVACAPTEYVWGKEDAAIALSYFEMAAKVRGLDTCWAGYLTHVASVHGPVRWMLKLPDGYSVRGAMMVGEGQYTYRSIPPRKPLSMQWC
jgi:nitroreductase